MSALLVSGQDDAETREWAARIALLALRTQVEAAVPAASLRVSLAGGPPLSLDSAAIGLASWDKPVACTAVLLSNHELEIHCVSVTDPALKRLTASRDSTVQSWERRLREYGAVERDPLLIVRSSAGRLTAPFSGLRRYFTDYIILGSTTLQRADTEAASIRASAIVTLFPPTAVEIDDNGPST